MFKLQKQIQFIINANIINAGKISMNKIVIINNFIYVIVILIYIIIKNQFL